MEVEKTIKDALEKQFIKGLSEGSKAMCGVILEKASAHGKTEHQKLDDVIKFCKKSLNLPKQ